MEKHFHRRNLPHLYFNEGMYFITTNLANTIPLNALKKFKQKPTYTDVKKGRLIQKYDSLLHSGNLGEKYLSNILCANSVKYALHFPDGKDYKLICYSIMPNHFHLVFELLPNNKGISKIMQSIKRISAAECNRSLNRKGKFWQDENFDRWIRNERELFYVIKYVLLNPVNAGLAKYWADWKYSYCNPDYLLLYHNYAVRFGYGEL